MQLLRPAMKLDDHPTVQRIRSQSQPPEPLSPLDAAWLRKLVLDAGADDVGFVPLDRRELDDQRDDILRAFPRAKALVSFVVRMNRAPIRAPARSVANLEFHRAGDHANDVARRVVRALEERGVNALNPAMGFPMEMDNFPDKVWVVSHKPVAVAAGLGRMGIHRSVIHPKFGSFILLGTVLVDAEVSDYSSPLDYNPCVECKLCVAACPVGAISPQGEFNFAACYTHNYREFMGGFTDWVEQVAASRSAVDYRRRVSDAESASMWQSLSHGANYKAAYCLSVCPAGEDVLGPYLADKKTHLDDVVKPLQEKTETVYVLANSDAEAHVAKRFPAKRTKRVGNSLRVRTIDRFLRGLRLVFQPGQAAQLNAVYHFTFTGAENRKATITIRAGRLTVEPDHIGQPNLRVIADAATWLGILAKEKSLVWALLRRKIRLQGPPRLLVAFGRCFPS
jgi:Fe-S-cluster-containing hydrogenase component 2